MSDIYIEPSKRYVASADKTDADSGGGGTSFIFHGDGGQPEEENHEESEHNEKKPVDFGDPVEVELSGEARGEETPEKDESDEDNESKAEEFENHPDPDKSHHTGTRINITV